MLTVVKNLCIEIFCYHYLHDGSDLTKIITLSIKSLPRSTWSPRKCSTWNPRNRRPPFNLECYCVFDKVDTFQGTAGVNILYGKQINSDAYQAVGPLHAHTYLFQEKEAIIRIK